MLPWILLAVIGSCSCGTLQFTIPMRKTECFFVQKNKGERLEAWFSVADGLTEISFAIFDSKDEVIHQESRTRAASVDRLVNETGDYGFCFSGYRLTAAVNVFFDLEPEMEGSVKKEVEERFTAEKRKFLNRVLRNIRFNEEVKNRKYNITEQFMLDVVRSHKEKVVGNDPNSGLQSSIMYLSILADSMLNSMQKHKVQMRSHFLMQRHNLYDVNLYSSIISAGILLSACVQIMVLKSFFTGSLSLKIWKF